MKIQGIEHWLVAKRTAQAGRNYAHQVLKENPEHWVAVRSQLCSYFKQAHEDIIRHMRRLAGASLHPLNRKRDADPARHYPFKLHESVLKGYFGEVFAGILAEMFAPGGHDDWEVPAFLFRNHKIAFQQLEQFSQSGAPLGPIPGRLGDDCLAFRRKGKSKITAVLYMEAKCTAAHDSGLLADAHEKLAGAAIVDILQIIEVLEDRGGPEAHDWIAALRAFRLTLSGSQVNRIDCICYVCGQRPERRATWINEVRPHEKYTGTGRFLEAVEIHLEDVPSRLGAVYAEEVWK